MKITALETQKRDNSRLNMYIDENFFCGISLNVVAKFGIYQGKELSDNELNEILNAELRERFFDRAVSFLVRSPKTEFQVRRYLRDLAFKKKGKWFKEISKEDISAIEDFVIKKLLEYEYLNDEKYAQLFVEDRIKNKPRGKNILYGELISKGVSKDIVEKVLGEMLGDEYAILVSTYKKRFKDESISFEDRKKIDFLRRKGFSWDLIEKFINDESSKQK
ncbi:MAG TPA: RecX family transcriptional regulator [Candidatus Dojkabacteria bacterium]|nr:RecX family transcriptional regulator [Candidatus Dojkabacteria bacterium]